MHKTGNKGLIFAEWSGILTKLSARWAPRQRAELKKFKKGLTARLKCGSLSELPLKESKRQLKLLRRKYLTRASESGKIKKLLRMQNGPRVENFWKKYLTNGMKFSIIAMFRRERRVPCKLNNVTKRKHQTETVLRDCNQKLRTSG